MADFPSAAAIFDGQLQYVAANGPWLEVFGIDGETLIGRRHHEVDPLSGPVIAELLRRALDGEQVESCELGEPDPAHRSRRFVLSARRRRGVGAAVGIVATVHEVSSANAEDGLPDVTDQLTGLAGRHRFMAHVRSIVQPHRDWRPTAMFLLDIDNFKGVNDLYGAGLGDGVLKIIANRLLAGTRSRPIPERAARRLGGRTQDVVARIGADEFGIALGNPSPSLADAEAFARRLLQLVGNPVMIGEECVRLSASIGYILTSPTHRNEDDAMRDLDVALQEAKARGPNGAKAWEPSLTSTVGRRLALLDQLRRALDEGEFVLHYQPILRLTDGKVVGAEALIRWNHPQDGLVPPAAFLPVLEESGLIVPVGCWVIREAVRQMQVWQMLYGRDILDWISINVSARQFNDPSLLMATLKGVNDSGFPLDRIKLEITESAVMRNPDITRGVLNELQDIGIKLAIDDFGTGYSALGVLRHYAVDTIKIDGGFTNRLDTHDGKELVLALLKIARIYGADVVAEGVETVSQADILRAAGCGFVQGYLYAKPMDGSFFGAYALTHLVENTAAD
ncbi:MAG TPA: EAL domain-containing protein [Stellaceae bacterium]|jgi:diguanylate cyclase (GGDEF)-like protein|nr:EAL domain-containing protein [Stellaceae bacterium]